jgi:hypothetical protein
MARHFIAFVRTAIAVSVNTWRICEGRRNGKEIRERHSEMDSFFQTRLSQVRIKAAQKVSFGGEKPGYKLGRIAVKLGLEKRSTAHRVFAAFQFIHAQQFAHEKFLA